MVGLHRKYDNIVVANSNYTSFSDTNSFETPYKFGEINTPLHSIYSFLPSGAVITYGVHRIESIRKTGGFYIYPGWIPQGIGEIILLYRILLQGSVGFIQKSLWKKRDSGYTFEKYSVLQNLSFSSPIVFRIIRYLKFPLLFLFDLVIQLKDTWTSSYSFFQKIVLSLICLRHYTLNMVEFVLNVLKGFLSVMKGIIGYFMKGVSHKE